MKRREVLAGAPIFKGRWSALAFTWWSGWLFGRVHPITDMITKVDLNREDYIFAPIAILMMICGVIFLDQYGRNCWFTWCPDDIPWGKNLYRKDVKRESWLSPQRTERQS